MVEEKQKIIITVEGGLIQWIKHIPEDIQIEVRDYDTDEEADDKNVFTDADGDNYFKGIWESDE